MRFRPLHFIAVFVMIAVACYFAGEFHRSGKVKRFSKESSLIEIDSASFGSHIKDCVCVVLFYTPHSTLCLEMEDKLNELKSKTGGMHFYKFNVESCESIADCYNVSGVPNMLIFREGKEEKRIMGVIPFSNMEMIYHRMTK